MEKYSFRVVGYAPELTEIFYNGVKMKFPVSVRQKLWGIHNTNDTQQKKYQKMVQLVRQNLNAKTLPFVKIELVHSYAPFNKYSTVKQGGYTSLKDVLQIARNYKQKNEGEKSVYIGEDKEGKPLYKKVYNSVKIVYTFGKGLTKCK